MKNPLATLSVVRINPSDFDPALADDLPAQTLREYVATRDPELLRFKPDVHPTWFQVRRLPMAFLTDVLDGVYPLAARRLLAFRAAVGEVTTDSGPVVAVDRDGAALKVWPKKLAPKGAAFVATDGEHGTDISPLEFAQAVADLYGAETVQEMGQVAIDLARLPRGKKGPFTSWAGSVASG